METWQKVHIEKNLPQLVETTNCSETLLSELTARGILDTEDTLKLEVCQNQLEKSSLLYSILQEKSSAFDKLAEALNATNQSEALSAILSGHVERMFNGCLPPAELSLPLAKWQELDEVVQEEILEQQVNFLGLSTKLKRILARINKHEASNILTESLNGDVLVNLQNNNKDNFNLTKDDIPHLQPDNYIRRNLVKHARIDPSKFDSILGEKDVFVFEGIEKSKLKKIITKGDIKCTSQIEDGHTFSKYIVTEFSGDFDRICMYLCKHNANFHFVKIASNEYFWERSKGNTKIFQKLLSANQVIIDDESITNYSVAAQSKLPVVICDAPGMGKSFLLAHIAQELKRNRENNIIFFNFREVLVHVSTIEKNLTVYTIKLLFSQLKADTLFGQRVLFEYLLSEWVQVNLFLDGFDELPFSQNNLALKLIKVISQDWNNCQMFITGRGNDRQMLESTLQVPSFSIVPFTEKNQVSLLVEYWSRGAENANKRVLSLVAKLCLKSIENCVNNFGLSSSQVPLQCRILAEVYKDTALQCLENEANFGVRNFAASMQNFSVSTLYKEFMKLKFAQVEYYEEESDKAAVAEKPARFSGLNWLSKRSSQGIQVKVYLAHVRAAFQVIFPEHVKIFEGVAADIEQIKTEIIYSVGLLAEKESIENNDGVVVRFVHNTFAEYLIADFIAGCLNNEYAKYKLSKDDILHFLLNSVLVSRKETRNPLKSLNMPEFSSFSLKQYTFTYPSICYFLNFHLAERQFSSRQWKSFSQYLQANSSIKYVSSLRQCFEMLASSLFDNYAEIFDICGLVLFFNGIYSFDKMPAQVRIEEGSFKFYWSDRHPHWSDMLYPAAMWANTELFESCADFIKSFEKYQSPTKNSLLDSYLCTSVDAVKPIHLAVYTGNYQIVEQILKRAAENKPIPLTTLKCLLHVCVKNSLAENDKIVQSKIQIVKLLCNEEKALLHQHDYNGWPPILMKNIHPQLIKSLIEQGASVFPLCPECNEVAQVALASLSRKCYDSVVQVIVEEGYKELITMPTNAKNLSVIKLIFKFSREACTLVLNKILAAKQSDLLVHKCALLQFAIQNIPEPEFIRVLVQHHGCDVNGVDAFGHSPLWYAKKLDGSLGTKKVRVLRALYEAGAKENFLSETFIHFKNVQLPVLVLFLIIFCIVALSIFLAGVSLYNFPVVVSVASILLVALFNQKVHTKITGV